MASRGCRSWGGVCTGYYHTHPDGFDRLPRSAKALSRYSDLVDSMARGQRELLDGASDEARIRLREWELPEALQVGLARV